MYPEVYMDLVFLTNLTIDFLLLHLIGKIFLCKRSLGRILVGASAGAVFSCVLLLLPIRSVWITGGMHLLCALSMLKWCYRVSFGRRLGEMTAMLYVLAFLLGGLWEAFAEKRADNLYTFFALLTGIYLGLNGIYALFRCIQVKIRRLYRVTIRDRENVWEGIALYDTGNTLCDIHNQRPVSVLSMKGAAALLGAEMADQLKNILKKPEEIKSTELSHYLPHFVPYRTINCREGMILVITLEELCIHIPGDCIRVRKPVFALLPDSSALGKGYDVLLNSRLLQ